VPAIDERGNGAPRPRIPEETMLKEGDRTPAVTGASYDGRTFDLGAPGTPTVLYFYPKANTSG
jgi:peroxiredoxin